jgi:hypothetical protein
LFDFRQTTWAIVARPYLAKRTKRTGTSLAKFFTLC